MCDVLQGYDGFEELRKFIKQGNEFSKEVAAILQERSVAGVGRHYLHRWLVMVVMIGIMMKRRTTMRLETVMLVTDNNVNENKFENNFLSLTTET